MKKIHDLFEGSTKGSSKDSSLMSWYNTARFYGDQFLVIIGQEINKNCIKLDHNRYQVTFFIENKFYRFIIKPTRGPTPLVLIKDENEVDVTSDVLSFINGYKGIQKLTPKTIGYKAINIYSKDGEETSTTYENEVLPFI